MATFWRMFAIVARDSPTNSATSPTRLSSSAVSAVSRATSVPAAHGDAHVGGGQRRARR